MTDPVLREILTEADPNRLMRLAARLDSVAELARRYASVLRSELKDQFEVDRSHPLGKN